jgi:hypothetical protein
MAVFVHSGVRIRLEYRSIMAVFVHSGVRIRLEYRSIMTDVV